MPRTARKKLEGAIYHIMARSISEVQLFKTDEDKKKYMKIIKLYQKVYNFKVYAYCLMDNHLHLIIDSNGADISKIMQCINFKYAGYYNAIHKRHGHLFQDRFKSRIVQDNRYLVALSIYIHNNPLDIKAYKNKPEKYYFSSLSVYIGLRKDPFNILDEKFILSIFGKGKKKSNKRYMNFILRTKIILLDDISKEEMEFEDEKTEYRSERKVLKRNFRAEDIIQYILSKFKMERTLLYLKYQKEVEPARAILVLLLRNLCNATCKDVCNILGNITSAGVSKLSSLGVELINNDKRYKNVIGDFIDYQS